MNKMLLAVAMAIGVMVVSSFVAYVMFNILESSAEASLQNWKFGGAMAGFAFTCITLATISYEFHKRMTSDEIKNLRDRNETLRNQIHELNSKLIRGAPCPKDYVTEVDEKYKLVFARPKNWSPKRGVLFQYECKENGLAPTICSVSCFTEESFADIKEEFKGMEIFKKGEIDVERLYQSISSWVIKRVSDEVDYLRTKLEDTERSEVFLDMWEEKTRVDNLPSWKLNYIYEMGTIPDVVSVRGFVINTFVPSFNGFYLFEFSSDKISFMKSSEIFNNIVNSIRFLP